APDAVEERGRDCRVACRRKAVRNGANVAVDAEDFLQHDNRAARLAGWRCKIGLKLMPVASHDSGEFAHEDCSLGDKVSPGSKEPVCLMITYCGRPPAASSGDRFPYIEPRYARETIAAICSLG